ncbi:uncharacterized protein [Amphiura filiformis]|uniref:uncharacterized protein isoform X2 n=1 Tax=Amphiura filiformis TaxID=82378 RepID=UPI003B20E556
MVAKTNLDASMDNVAADTEDIIINTNHTTTPHITRLGMPPQRLSPPPLLLPPPHPRPRTKVIRRASFDMALEMGHRRDMYNRQRFGSGGMLSKLQRLFMACQCRTINTSSEQSLHSRSATISGNITPTESHMLAAKFDSQPNGMEPDFDKLLTQLASEEPTLKDAPIEKTFLYLVLKVERQKCQLQAAEAELKELRRERDEAQSRVQRLRRNNNSVESEGSEFTTSDTQSTNNSGRKRHDSKDKGSIKEHDIIERTSSASSSKSNQSKGKSKASTKRKHIYSNDRQLHHKAHCPVLSPSELEVVTKGEDEPVVLGQGNCGRVDLMRLKATGDLVAVKTVLPENQVEPEKWILREVRALKAVTNHDAFSQLYGVVDHNPLTTVVVQFVGDYTTLAPITVQSALEDGDPPLSDGDWIMVCRDMANGLDALHKKGFLHCDVKMDNVLLWREPMNSYSRWQAKIIDLDSARNLDDLPDPLQLSSSEKEQCFQFMLHIAPELIEGTTTYTTQTEIYALGLLFSDIADQSQDNRDLKRLGAKCLDRKPRRRPKMGYIIRKLNGMKI